MSSWNYRIFKHVTEFAAGEIEESYQLHEAYYEEGADEPHSWTVEPVAAMGETVDELIKDLERQLADAKRYRKEVLDYD